MGQLSEIVIDQRVEFAGMLPGEIQLSTLYAVGVSSKANAKRPSTYLQRILYDTVVYDQRALQMCLEAGGADNLLYGSDYPHNIGDMAGCLARVNALPADQARRVAGKNARRVFGI